MAPVAAASRRGGGSLDPTATPWRVLDESRGGTPTQPSGPQSTGTFPRSFVLATAGVVAFGAVAFFLAFGTGSSGSVLVEGTEALNVASMGPGSQGETSPEPDLVVEIVGAVARPGVFHVPAGARVGDLVEAAGGYSSRVDAARASQELNLAARLADGDQVRVPSRDDEVPAETAGTGGVAGTGPGGGSKTGGLVDLNRATAAELESLPGIGPVTANKILSARDEAPFASVDDLRTRKLVGEKTFEKVKDLVTVR